MVRDDQDIKDMTHETEDSMREALAAPDLKHKINYFVCRATDGSEKIYGYMGYVLSDAAYLVGDPGSKNRPILLNSHDADECIMKGDYLEPVADLVNFGFLDNFAVHKDCRGQGVAQGMLGYFEQDCRNHGKQLIVLGVEPDNEKAKRAYRRFGFETHPVYPIAMVKKLEKAGMIVLLNGTSTAGKSSLVKELQKQSGNAFFVISFDDFISKYEKAIDSQLDFIVERDDEFFKYIKDSSKIYDKVLVDTVDHETVFEKYDNFLGEGLIKILVYAPLPELLKRVEKRNHQPEYENEHLKLFLAFTQFLSLYKMQSESNEPTIDKIHTADIKNILCEIKKELDEFDVKYPAINPGYLPASISERAVAYEKLVQDAQDLFKFKDHRKIKIIARQQIWDLTVNSGANSSVECAHEILAFLEAKI